MSFGGTVKLTGESEYKKALKEIASNLKVLGSEMKVVTSQYDSNDKSAENLSSQNEVLNKQIAEQEKKVNILKEALEKSKSETDGNSETTKKWQTQLNNAQAELNTLNKKLNDNTKTMDEAITATKDESEAIEDFGEEAEKSGDKALSLGDIIKGNLISDAIMSGLSGLANGIKSLGSSFGAILDLGESTKETQTAMSKLEASFESANLSIDDANDSVYALQGVLGDMDKSVEASNLLSKMSKDSEDLEANTRILTGVFAEYGESIPTEGLAEGMQATAEMGSVQGVLADALEWQGVNLDTYNEKLATMTSSEERAAYIQKTLTDLYGESADAYRENNQALIESNEAQLRYEQNLAEIGKLSMPIQTSLKNISSDLIMNFSPALESTMGGLNNLTGAFEELIETTLYGGDMDTALAIVSDGITNFVESIKTAVPQIMNVAGSLIDTFLSVITENSDYILESGASLLLNLVSGISNNIGELIPVVLDIVSTLTSTLLSNLHLILEMGMSIIVSLASGIGEELPTLIPLLIDTVILMCTTLIDNLDLILDAGMILLMGLAQGLLDALPKLINALPILIESMVSFLTSNGPKLLEMGVKLVVQLASGLIQAIPQLASKIPQIITSLVSGLKNGLSNMAEVGKNLLEGLWEGIKNAKDWLVDKVKSLGKTITTAIKEVLGIHSPSRVFRDEIGTNMALGLGEGFENTMKDITTDIQNSIPTEFDTSINAKMSGVSTTATFINYDLLVAAFKQALSEVKVVMDDREMGEFVTNTVEKAVYA